MARFDIYRNPAVEEREWVPYVLDVQNSYISVGSRVVIPLLMSARLSHKARDLNPQFVVNGDDVVLHTSAIAGIDESVLRNSIGNLSAHQSTIQQALDTLFGGY